MERVIQHILNKPNNQEEIFIEIDRVFFLINDGKMEVAKEWIKGVIKEALAEMESEE